MCSSKPQNITYCPLGVASVITEVKLLHNSGKYCNYSSIHPKDWKEMSEAVYGYRENFLWVANGCNAKFRVQYDGTFLYRKCISY